MVWNPWNFSVAGLLLVATCSLQSQTAPVPGPVQPIPFSHLIHVVNVKLTCADCHTYPAKFGDAVGIPNAPRCLECHGFSLAKTTTRNDLNAFVTNKQVIPWVRIFALPAFAFFDHRYHLLNGATCEGCHGPVAEQHVLADPLKSTKMAFCQPCHVKTGAKTGCTTCHDQR